MNRRILPLLAVSLLVLPGGLPSASETRSDPATPLTLARAEALATQSADPSLERRQARARALEETAVADAQLPDPMVTAQVANVPTDSFALDQADMTQLRFGLRQEFPAGATLAARARQRHSEAQAERAKERLERREILLATRQAWFELAYQQHAIEIIGRSRESVAQQLESLSARFATGRITAQDVLRSELELALLEDRLIEHRRLADSAREALARYIGAAAAAPIAEEWPSLPRPEAFPVLLDRLTNHPAVAVESAQMAAAEAGVALAEEAYKPAWALEGGYGVRDERPDFASIGITLSLPLFTDKRQDRRHQAAVRLRGAERLDRDAVLLDLKRRLQQALADWQRFSERTALYHRAVREHARRTAEASVSTYANGQTDFAELIRSQLAELDVQVKQAELDARAGQAWARIAYLTGDRT